ncbi:FAD/NAD(P)-binding protein [Streptomyces sp. NPDC093252]|uniref:FAD/NAD(P)-binding protein n=1 Tax=Streptomyces sp. NPDC093252 TaxID=3154980 RepID=UPI0034324AEC
MTSARQPYTVAIVGAGAAGTLTALQVCETALRRRTPLALVLVDPAPEAGRGTAYATRDPRHRLNVPAGNMSCYPDDPGHFTRWLARHGEPEVTGADFATRYRYGAYLADTFAAAVVRARGTVSVRRLRTRVESCTGAPGDRVDLHLADGGLLTADRAVLATGPAAPTAAWAPRPLRTSPRFVARPWEPGALDGATAAAPDAGPGDVLLVGSGLTAVDLALALDRPGRVVHVVSRSGLLPQPHALTPAPAMPAPPLSGPTTLGRLRRTVYRHVARALRTHGDWRPALDSLRPQTAQLWRSLTPDERAEFLAREGALWNTHRHRMAPATAESVTRARTARRLTVHTGTVVSAAPGGEHPLTLTLSDGTTLGVGWVVDCTGPGRTTADDPLWAWLLATGAARPGPLGMGVATEDGRVTGTSTDTRTGTGTDARTATATDTRTATGTTAGLPLFTLGAPRRGELWETTAIPEIRVQAAALARDHLVPPTRAPRATRRPVDGHGLPLSTHADAAAAYRRGLDRVLKVRAGAEDAFARAVAADPGFALGHAALALLGHECGAAVDVPRALADAQRCARERADARERSFVDVVTRRVHGDGGDTALVHHLDAHPGDALALAAAVPTIAFSGVDDLDDDYALHLVERTSPAHDGHWFHTSLLAFLRQEQGRLHEAGELAHRVLAAEPAAGHAVHALAHVHYETGAHERGRDWLDGWVAGRGRGAVHRAHFSWHVALHELALDDPAAVRKRWHAQLAPGRVAGVRALVDSGSMLWRARLSDNWPGPLPAGDVLAAVEREVLERPATAFTALHSAVALTAAGDLAALRRLRDHAAGADRTQREIVAPLCEALAALTEERFAEAARGLTALLPVLRRVGGSAAQREIVEETLLYALVSAGRCEAAQRLLTARLDRKEAPRDRRMMAELTAPGGPSGTPR